MDAKRAVEVLEEAVALADGYAVELGLVEAQKLAIAALKAQGEPVAWMVRSYEKGVEYIDLHYSEEEAQEAAECMPLSLPKVIALYTAPQPESAMRPKRLEWVRWENLTGVSAAESEFGDYRVLGSYRREGLKFAAELELYRIGYFDSEADAKAAAQADYDRRALACFEPQPESQPAQRDLSNAVDPAYMRNWSQPAQAVPDGFGKLTRTDLVDYATFVERWVIHHAAKDCVSDSEVVGMIRAHPLTKQITEYVTGTAAPAPGGDE